MTEIDLRLGALARHYKGGASVESVIGEVTARIEAYADPAVWIARVPEEKLAERAKALDALAPEDRGHLHGVPFAVKDNIDVAGMPTTMACPDAAYTPKENAPVVQRLLDAGAVLMGKTNLDQFATGLVGVRSPYGAPRCVFDAEYVSGGSSSGSGVAVAGELVTFSLGTDTAGSGRVPAAFNNIVGVKPTRGLLSTRGVFPANRTLDCVSIFALDCATADEVRRVAQEEDTQDPFSRAMAAKPLPLERPRIGVPRDGQLRFFGDNEAHDLFASAVTAADEMGWEIVPFDFAPFGETATLLYGSAWVAERLAAIKPYLDKDPDMLHPVTREIIEGAGAYDAADAFKAIYRVEELRTRCREIAGAFDAILVPTTPTIYKVAEVEADPIQLNANLGTYTNFCNLLDMAGVAVPAGFRDNGLPFGVTLVGPAFTDDALAVLADKLHRQLEPTTGKARRSLSQSAPLIAQPGEGLVSVAVLGAHLDGQPLNWQLTDRGGVLLETTRTAGCYRFYALTGTVPAKPGIERVEGFDGAGIEVEVWALSPEAFGEFVDEVPPPLAIGSLELADGRIVNGFVCEPYALGNARDITALGGWRAFVAEQAKEKAS